MTMRGCSVGVLCLWLLLVPSLAVKGGGAIEKSENTFSTSPQYRVSKPASKQPTKRVPSHLQDIRQGYVDDDAGDVIRIIEPPQHFQQLKRRRQQLGERPPAAIIWEQPRKLSINPPAVTRPPTARPPQTGDLLTQETATHLSAHSPPQSNQLNHLQLPFEILASVRKTENLLKRQHSKAPLVRQRHIMRQTHTLISQKALEQQSYKRGQEQRLRAALTQEHKRSKRVKRQLQYNGKKNKQNLLAGNYSYDVQQGLKLVEHIGELLKNATFYLPDELEPNAVAQVAAVQKRKPRLLTVTSTTPTPASEVQQACTNSTKCNIRLQQQRRRRLQLFKLAHGTRARTSPTTTTIANATTTTQASRNFRHEATAATPTLTAKTTSTTTTTTSTTTTTPSTTKTIITTIASLSPRRWSGKMLASRLVNSSKSSLTNLSDHLSGQLPKRRSDLRKVARKIRIGTDESAALTRASADLLYDDVMTNIRQLWQEHDATIASSSNQGALQVYLKELQDIASKLPAAAPITTQLNNNTAVLKVTLNREEVEPTPMPMPTTTTTPHWYMINKEGKILEAHPDSETEPAVALFHRFPDIPKADDNLQLQSESMLDI